MNTQKRRRHGAPGDLDYENHTKPLGPDEQAESRAAPAYALDLLSAVKSKRRRNRHEGNRL